MAVVLACAAVLACVALVPYAVLRRYASRLRRRDLDPAEKVHRLHRSMALAIGAGVAIAVPLTIVAVNVLPRDVAKFALGAVIVAAALGSSAAIQPVYREIRGIEKERPRVALRKTGLALAVGTLPPVVLFGGLALLPDSVSESPLVRPLIFITYVIAISALAPGLFALLSRDASIDPKVERDLVELCRKHGFEPRGIKAMPGRKAKVANALFTGLLPRARYIFVTDYLVDTFDRDELRAVVAHELGHAKEHHLWIRVGALAAAQLMLLVSYLVGRMDDPVSDVAGVVLGIFAVVGLWWSVWGLPLRLERRADDFAARAVGVDATVAALERLAEVNMIKRRTGRIWNVLTNHPSIEQRVDRLRKRDERSPKPSRGRLAAPGR